VRLFLYALTILLIPGGFLFCIAHGVGRAHRRRVVEMERMERDNWVRHWRTQNQSEAWARQDPYGHGSASSYVPEWAEPLAKTPKRRKTDRRSTVPTENSDPDYDL
jgi:hypothetical protein